MKKSCEKLWGTNVFESEFYEFKGKVLRTPDENLCEKLRDANLIRQDEWAPGIRTDASFRGNELAGEVGEACNVIKKLERERLGIPGSRDTVEHLAEELADVVICCDLIAILYGIDLDKAVAKKFNMTSEKMGLKTRMAE